ncbi:MAG: RluA family pseudouridine synthase [Candidatus Scatovivens sp.]
MKELIVNEKYNNKKLSHFIMDTYKNLSFNEFNKALRKKDIKINGSRVNKDITVHLNDVIAIYILDNVLFGTSINIKKIFEDENILIVFKPQNISVISNLQTEITLTTILKEKYGDSINPCHRLDRNTTGLVLFAKNEEALNILLKKFKNKEIEKHYKATVYGIPKKDAEILEAYLFKDSKKSLVYISKKPKEKYSKIITEYSVISKDLSSNTSILDINLHTGKTHQIRAHLAFMGLPIIGDGKYGINKINKKFNKKTQMLSSYSIKFNFKTDAGILNYLKDKEVKI